jgi:bacteriocin biosynthesis cyclodehydratase domain-containing protein
LPRLLPLLDGVRDHDAIAEELGVTASNVFTALSLLWTCGVVEEAAPTGIDVDWVADHLADYLSRIGDATEANAAWEGAAQRLAEARLRFAGDAAFVAAMRAELRGTFPHGEDDGEPTLVIACVTDSEPLDRALTSDCWRNGTPLLRIALHGDLVWIGPYVDRRVGPCLDCLTADEDQTSEGQTTASTQDDVELAAALAAADLVALLSRAARVGLPSRWRRVSLSRLGQSPCSGATRPGCPACSTLPSDEVRPAPVSARYEAAVALPPREYADVKAHQVHYQPANVALQRGHKSWPVAPRRSLPPVDFGLLTAPSGDLDDGRLALILAIAAGWQHEAKERVWRWTASGGNIGSVVAHVLVRDIDGLAPGCYGYVSADHELALLREGRPDACAPDCAAPACVLLTGDLPRVASKYGAFGLRVVLLDAGCAQSALVTVAEALGLAARTAADIDDERFGSLLDIDLDSEPVTGLIHLGERR